MVEDATQAAGGEAGNSADAATGGSASGADGGRDDSAQAKGFQESVIEPARRAGEAVRSSGQKMVEGGSTVGLKMIDQAEQNAHQAFLALREAASAKDIAQVMKIQGDYLREQSARSMAQAREIGELIMQFGRDAVAPLRGDGQS